MVLKTKLVKKIKKIIVFSWKLADFLVRKLFPLDFETRLIKEYNKVTNQALTRELIVPTGYEDIGGKFYIALKWCCVTIAER